MCLQTYIHIFTPAATTNMAAATATYRSPSMTNRLWRVAVASLRGDHCLQAVSLAAFVSTVSCHSIILVQWHLMSSQDDDETL